MATHGTRIRGRYRNGILGDIRTTPGGDASFRASPAQAEGRRGFEGSFGMDGAGERAEPWASAAGPARGRIDAYACFGSAWDSGRAFCAIHGHTPCVHSSARAGRPGCFALLGSADREHRLRWLGEVRFSTGCSWTRRTVWNSCREDRWLWRIGQVDQCTICHPGRTWGPGRRSSPGYGRTESAPGSGVIDRPRVPPISFRASRPGVGALRRST